MKLKILLIVSAMCLANNAFAAQYYVSTTGDNNNNGLSEATAFRTIQKGADVAKAGDTVWVLPGTYVETGAGNDGSGGIVNKNDGTASARIRFVSKVRWGAKVSSPTHTNLWYSYADYVDIEGFEVIGITGATSNTSLGIVVRGAYSRVLYNHLHDFRKTGCNRGIAIDTTGYDTNFGSQIIGNVIHDIGGPSLGPCDGTDRPGRDRGYGIYLATKFGKVQNNIIYNCGDWGIHLWHIPDNSVLSHNLIFNNKNGINLGAGDSPFTGTGDNIMVSNNIVMNNENYGIRGYGQIGNNTRIMNNITFRNGPNDIVYVTSRGIVDRTRLLPLMSGNKIGVDPQLGSDYQPRAGSPAIDGGTTDCVSGQSSCVPPFDFKFAIRPYGNGVDIGAYEFGSPAGSGGDIALPPAGDGSSSAAGGECCQK